MENEKTKMYDAMIQDLDRQHEEEKSSQLAAAGNRREVYNQVGKNMLFEKEYLDKRKKLVELKNDSIEVSPGVEAWLNPKKVETKFDLDNGSATLDDSLNPLSGKSL